MKGTKYSCEEHGGQAILVNRENEGDSVLTDQGLKQSIKEVVVQEIAFITCTAPEVIDMESRITENPLCMDSLDMVEFAIEMESKFEVKISEEDWFEEIYTVGDMVSRLHKDILASKR